MPAIPSLFPILDDALASAVERSGPYLACRPGCHACCIGVFTISPLDAESLRSSLTTLETTDPDRAARIHQRAFNSRARLTPEFPGDATTGQLFTEPHHEAAFDDFANDEPCPVLDPATGTCDLYSARPVQCRTFGPPILDADHAIAVCELCFLEAPESAVTHALMDQSWRPLEDNLIAQTLATSPQPQPTLIAFALTAKT
jgi:Fe-S-cluster containining protein